MFGLHPFAAAPFADAGVTSVGYSMTADAGSFTLTGQAVDLDKAVKLSAASGSFSLSGQAATLRHGRTLTADSGSFALTGQDVTLNKCV